MNTSNLPPPPVPPDCDLRGNEWMPFHGNRIFISDRAARATDSQMVAAIKLSWAAWQQVPASGLPDDDQVLMYLAGYQRDLKGWNKVRDVALTGFVKHSDGRLYDPFLSNLAVMSWTKRVNERERKAAYRKEKGDEAIPKKRQNKGFKKIVPWDKTRKGAGQDVDKTFLVATI